MGQPPKTEVGQSQSLLPCVLESRTDKNEIYTLVQNRRRKMRVQIQTLKTAVVCKFTTCVSTGL